MSTARSLRPGQHKGLSLSFRWRNNRKAEETCPAGVRGLLAGSLRDKTPPSPEIKLFCSVRRNRVPDPRLRRVGGAVRRAGALGRRGPEAWNRTPRVPARTEHPAAASWSRGCSRGPGPGPTRGFPAFGSSRPLSISGRSGLLPGKPSARPGLAVRRWGSHRGPPAATARHRRLFMGRESKAAPRRETGDDRAQSSGDSTSGGRGLVRPQGRRRGPRPLRVALRPHGQRLSCP